MTSSRYALGLVLALCTAAHAQDGFRYPLDVAVSPSGAYVADLRLPGVWSVADGKAEIYFQGEQKIGTPLKAIRCLAVDNEGRLLAGDTGTRNVYRFDESGKPSPLLKDKVGIGMPMAIAVNTANELLVADLESHRIMKIADGAEAVEFAKVPAPRGLAIDDEDRLWVVSHGKDQVLRIDKEGNAEVLVKGRPFKFPHQIALDGEGGAYVADGYGKAIHHIDGEGKVEEFAAGGPFKNPVGLALSDNQLLVADPQAKALLQVDAEGKISTLVGEGE